MPRRTIFWALRETLRPYNVLLLKLRMTVESVHFDSTRVQPPRETSSGATTTHIAQHRHVYPSTIAPTKQPAALPGRRPPARVRSWRLPVQFTPFLCNSQQLFSFRSCPFWRSPRTDARLRRRRCSARRPQPAHAIPLPLTRQPRVGYPPRTRRRCCLSPVGAP
jgi:hypothetical protein